MTQQSDLRSDPFPTTVSAFLDAHNVHTAASLLTEDAVVADQGETFEGRPQIHAFLRTAGSEFDYTTEQIGARRVDDDHWVVALRLEGIFPGGVAELDYRFALRGDLVSELVIANHQA